MLGEVDVPDGVRGLKAYNPDGGGLHGDSGSLGEAGRLGGDAGCATFSPDGGRLLTLGEWSVDQWDAANGQRLPQTLRHHAQIRSVRFSRDGSRIVTASEDGTARVWDTASGRLLVSLEEHSGAVTYADLSPDRTRVVTAGADGTAKVWEAEGGRLLASLAGHTGPVLVAVFGPGDGSRLVTASEDGTANVWDLPLETRTAEEIGRLIRCRVPLRLDEGRLVPEESMPVDCVERP